LFCPNFYKIYREGYHTKSLSFKGNYYIENDFDNGLASLSTLRYNPKIKIHPEFGNHIA